MAFLYRAHIHAHNLQLDLVRRNIPFNITIGVRFFEQAHIKDVAAYLKFVINPRDELSFKRLVQLLPGIGAKGADKLWKTFVAPGNPVPDAPEAASEKSKTKERHSSSETRTPIAAALQRCVQDVPKRAAAAWAQFSATIAQLEVDE